ncbi:MAG TPA: response regulator [Clostridia bacterium]|nr:response regulator [Clostridia bacterium]
MALKILLADDSMTAQNMAKKILADAGYEVIAVSNGAAAVKKFAEIKPDLAILDIYMPGYTGLEVCERIKNALETSNIPVLLTVGKMEPYRPDDGAKVKADGVIIKPFEASDLIAAVAKLAESIVAVADRTIAESASAVEDFKDEGDEEWKTGAEDEAQSTQATVPEEMSGLPVFGMEELSVEAPVDMAPFMATGAAFSPVIGNDFYVQPPASSGEFAIENSQPASAMDAFGLGLAPSSDIDSSFSGYEVAPAASMLMEPAASPVEPAFEPVVEPVISMEPSAAPLDVEYTSAPTIGELDIEVAAELEPTILQQPVVDPGNFAIDPALVTDATERVSAFPTTFGVESAEESVVGIATDESDLLISEPDGGFEPSKTKELLPAADELSDAAHDDFVEHCEATPQSETSYSEAPLIETTAALPSALVWQAEETKLEPTEASASLEDEMEAAFAEFTPHVEPPAPESIPEPVSVEAEQSATLEVADTAPDIAEAAIAAPALEEQAAQVLSEDHDLAAAMHAAISSLEPEPEPAPERFYSELVHSKPLDSEPFADIETEVSRRELVPLMDRVVEAPVVQEPATAMPTSAPAVVSEVRIAAAVQRVMERFKQQLVWEIARELSSEQELE